MGNRGTINKKQFSSVPQPHSERKIVVIPYQKWIYGDARRFKHLDQFSTDDDCEIISNNNTILSVLLSLLSSLFSTSTSFVPASLSLTNDFIV